MRELFLLIGIIGMFMLIYELWVLIDVLQTRYVPEARNESKQDEEGANESEPRRGR